MKWFGVDVLLAISQLILMQIKINDTDSRIFNGILALRDSGICRNFASNSTKMTTMLRGMSCFRRFALSF